MPQNKVANLLFIICETNQNCSMRSHGGTTTPKENDFNAQCFEWNVCSEDSRCLSWNRIQMLNKNPHAQINRHSHSQTFSLSSESTHYIIVSSSHVFLMFVISFSHWSRPRREQLTHAHMDGNSNRVAHANVTYCIEAKCVCVDCGPTAEHMHFVPANANLFESWIQCEPRHDSPPHTFHSIGRWRWHFRVQKMSNWCHHYHHNALHLLVLGCKIRAMQAATDAHWAINKTFMQKNLRNGQSQSLFQIRWCALKVPTHGHITKLATRAIVSHIQTSSFSLIRKKKI